MIIDTASCSKRKSQNLKNIVAKNKKEIFNNDDVVKIKSEIRQSSISDDSTKVIFRDVTSEVNRALSLYMTLAQQVSLVANAVPLYEPYRYGMFGLLVNHGSIWDIKRKDLWEFTIGTKFPGDGALITYQGMIMTPEKLGNYTYGVLGAAFGIPYQTLIHGSIFAAFSGGTMNGYNGMANEIGDWNYILLGYFVYYFSYNFFAR